LLLKIIEFIFSNSPAKVVHIQETTVPWWEKSVSKRENKAKYPFGGSRFPD
jgi:hypothetical protein